jgi:hypothetical protein
MQFSNAYTPCRVYSEEGEALPAREIQRMLSRQGGSAMETKQKGEDGEERK